MINCAARFFIPIHGVSPLKRHASAGAMDVVEKVILLEDGEVLELTRTRAENGRSPWAASASMRRLDRCGGDIILPRPQHIGEGGIVLPILTINNARQGEVAPEIVDARITWRTRHDRRRASWWCNDPGCLQRRGEGNYASQGKGARRPEATPENMTAGHDLPVIMNWTAKNLF